MTASETAKAAGLASLKELAEMSKQSPQTLTNWHNNKPELFDLVVKGAAVRKKCETIIRFKTANEPHVPVEVSALYVFVDWTRYTHEEFRAGRAELIEADSQRVRKAIDQFYIFAGDLL